ncbi:MAG: hypothetical protein WBB32_09160 [Flavobacteriales bacterium]
MLKPFFILTFMLLCSAGAVAQTPGSATSSAVLQSCFMGTPASFWTAQKLTPDQSRRMEAIYEACKTECDLPGVQKDDNAISSSDGSTVMAELKNILTMDQYAAWTSYCSDFGKEGKSAAPSSK